MSTTKSKSATTKTRKDTLAKSAAAKRKTPAASKKPSRIDQLQQLLTRANGASIAEMVEKTGWLQHSVRGALAGALKKRGLAIMSDKVEGVRRYRATVQA